MSKKQRARKEQKLEQKRRGNAPPSWMTEEMSPQIRRAMTEMSGLSKAQSEEAMMQALMDSAELRKQPELEAFHFEPKQVEKVMGRLLPQYEQKLISTKAIGNEEWEATYDDLRVEAIDALLSREWRQNFLRQYDAMMRRLGSGTDPDTFKLALMVRSVLDDKTFPWGGSALFGEMFEDAKTESMQRVLSAEELLAQLLKPLGAEATPEELDKILQDPARLAELEATLKLSPEQQEAVDEMTSEVMEEFERELYAGNVDLPLYTNQELNETTDRLNALTAAVRDEGREMGVADYEAIGRVLQERVAEIVTPERLNEINEQVTLTADEWLNSGNEDGRLLHMEQGELLEVEPRENSFLYAALIGQLRRVEEPEGEFDQEIGEYVIDATEPKAIETPEAAESVAAETTEDATPNAAEPLDEESSKDLRERLRGMFKRPI